MISCLPTSFVVFLLSYLISERHSPVISSFSNRSAMSLPRASYAQLFTSVVDQHSRPRSISIIILKNATTTNLGRYVKKLQEQTYAINYDQFTDVRTMNALSGQHVPIPRARESWSHVAYNTSQ